jgi:hypothetical protein
MIAKTLHASVLAASVALAGCGLEAHQAVRHAITGPVQTQEKIAPAVEVSPDVGTPPTTDDVLDMSLG